MDIQIKEILAKQTYELRHPLLRKGQPYDSCQLENDNHPQSIHLGAYSSSQLVGILSAMPNCCPDYNDQIAFQLRAMAVHPEFQRRKIASQLIQNIVRRLKEDSKVENIWLNARVNANALYLNNGFQAIGSPFEIKPIGVHQRFIKWMIDES
ncbi:MAG: GNAT family N-acetyltransferase [Flavobacteriaceae bacterium]|jgi:GNAT superfamily N-acetyltransferase|nr:GNAT family N-acetyltransferase [Flavobacteriaceae bacterium]